MAVQNDPAPLYLDLLKKTLSFSLWEDPGIPIQTFSYRKRAPRRWFLNALARALARRRLELVKKPRREESQKEEGKIWPIQADTMVGLKRLDNIQFCVESALRDQVPGDLVEAGVWRGGSCILMRAILAAHGVSDRRVFVCDSFEGLPEPDAEKYPHDAGDRHHTQDFLAVPLEQVQENFRRYGLLDEQVYFLKGWFKDTLPTLPSERLAVVRLDGDMYQSTIEGLTFLYPKLSRGGYCIIDDFALEGCRKAVEDYRNTNGIKDPIRQVDWTGVFWRKE